MKFLFLDQSSGVSGDKINAALFGLHGDRDFIGGVVRSLHLHDVTADVASERVSGLSAWKFSVHDGAHAHGHHHRGLKEITDIIDASTLSDKVRELAKRIFRILGEAEASVHGVDLQSIHFHEVGAVDAICDIVCAAAQVVKLSPDRIFATPFNIESGGEVRCAHGIIPVPVPAVMEIIKGMPVRVRDVYGEITTPTGAAIIRGIADEYRMPGSFISEAVSYGAGTKEFAFPNILRVVYGDTIDPVEDTNGRRVFQIETQVDDMNPQIVPEVIDGLLKLGARDAFCVQAFMKKGRPGFLFIALAEEDCLERCLDSLFSATTTIGVRYFPVERKMLDREIITRQTDAGELRFKKVRLPDGSFREVPEFEDVKAAAARLGVTVQQAYSRLGK